MAEVSDPGVARETGERYDACASVQRSAARDVLSLLGGRSPASILEPGCGTGMYTAMLARAFPSAKIQAVDIDGRALEAARLRLSASPSVRFLLADAEGPIGGRYDIITSNAAIHWFRDLAGTLKQYHGMLAENGLLAFSYFGPETFGELRESLRETIRPRISIAAERFAGYARIEQILRSVFTTAFIEEKRRVQIFASLKELLENIKATGTRGKPRGPRVNWTRRLIARVEEAYLRRYGRIEATYQVFLCRGLK